MNGISCGVPIYDFPVPDWNKGKKQTYAMTPKKLVIHNTWNTAKAKAEASYMVGNSNWTSFHSVVDDEAIFECIPFTRNAWHAGETYANRNYIGVEIAKSRGDLETFKKCEVNAAKYSAAILKKYGWGLENMIQHYDVTRKDCPHRTRELGWQRFKNMVAHEMGQKVEKPVVIERKGGFSVKVDVPSNDTLTVRKGAGVSYPKVSSYRPNSIIYVESIVKGEDGADWYKIPAIGYVHSAYCKKVETGGKVENKPKIVIYKSDGDKDGAGLIAWKLGCKMIPDNGTINTPEYGGKDKYEIVYVGAGKDRWDSFITVAKRYKLI